MSIQSHRDLVAWRKAFELGLDVYTLTAQFPGDERFGVVGQLRRAAVSVSSDIAEGYGRGSTADYVRFLRHARGSLYEIDTQLLFARRLGFIDEAAHGAIEERLNECGRVLAGLIRSIEDTLH